MSEPRHIYQNVPEPPDSPPDSYWGPDPESPLECPGCGGGVLSCDCRPEDPCNGN